MEPTIGTEDVWRQLHERLLAFIRGRVASGHDAEDVLQDVFVRIHRNVQNLRDTERIHAWVYQIARNAIADHFRARAKADKAVAKAAEAPLTDGAPADEQQADEPTEELARCMRPLLQQLPESYREAISLTELGSLTQKEAAGQLGLSVPGMKARVQRGRKKLKGLLLDCCDVELDRRREVIDYKARQDGQCDECGCADPD